MPRIAILGGGISGLTAAYELEQQRRRNPAIDWHLFESTGRLGGTIQTTRLQTPEGEYILEDGPDGWVTEKPWARELAEELGLGPELIPCNEAERRTYISLDNQLVPMPPRMRLMVPEDLSVLDNSPLFSEAAKRAYANELTRAAELKAAAPTHDESVAAFILRHFGPEVLAKVAAPLLAGVFGGDVGKLSVRAVMPQFVQMERDHGSLIAALQAKARNRPVPPPTFTSLRLGMGSLTEALVQALPTNRLHGNNKAVAIQRSHKEWLVRFTGHGAHSCAFGFVPFDHLLLATPNDTTHTLLKAVDPDAGRLLPTEASSAVLITFCWPESLARTVQTPTGFGFLVPPATGEDAPRLLAATFAHQKYACRAPAGGKAIRVFFGNQGSYAFAAAAAANIAEAALTALRSVMGPLPSPDPTLTTVRHWPRSLPQYEVGHLNRMAELKDTISRIPGLHLLGNSYHGVGIPDLIRDARQTARTLAQGLNP